MRVRTFEAYLRFFPVESPAFIHVFGFCAVLGVMETAAGVLHPDCRGEVGFEEALGAADRRVQGSWSSGPQGVRPSQCLPHVFDEGVSSRFSILKTKMSSHTRSSSSRTADRLQFRIRLINA